MTRDGRGIAGRILMCIVLALILGSHCLVAEPQVVQPYSPEFSSAERSALLSALGGLEKLLLDRTLGSQVWQGQQGWDTHQFALFSAGVMEDRGYQVALVTSASWPGGSHTWVLIGVDLGGRTGWIPVEAAPGLGASQRTLGSVPWAASGSGDFDERYASFDEAVDLGPNLPPIAHIRPPMG